MPTGSREARFDEGQSTASGRGYHIEVAAASVPFEAESYWPSRTKVPAAVFLWSVSEPPERDVNCERRDPYRLPPISPLTAVRPDPRRVARLLLVAAAITLALLHSQSTMAATRTWTGLGVTNNWNDAANWSGGLIPGAADVATFDGTSSKNAIVNVAVNVGGVSIAGYGGTITQAAGIAVTVGATGWTQAGGTFVGGTAAFTLNGPYQLTSGGYTTTSGTMTVTGAFTVSGGTFSAPAGTVSFSGAAATLTMSTPDTFNNLTFASTKSIAAGTTLTVTGTHDAQHRQPQRDRHPRRPGRHQPGLDVHRRDGHPALNGSAAQTFTGTATTDRRRPAPGRHQQAVRHAHPGRHASGPRTTGRTPPARSTPGTVDASSSRAARSPAATPCHGRLPGDHDSIAAGTTLTVSGPLTLTAGSLNGTGTLAAQGDVSQALGYGGGTATLLINGSGAQTLTGASTTASGNLPLVVINKPVGHAHPGRHHPDHQQLDVHRGHARPGHLDARLRRRHDHRLAHASTRSTSGRPRRSRRARR